MATLFTDFGIVATNVLSMAGDVVEFVVATPLLLIPIAIGFLGAGIGIVKSFR